MTIIDYLSTVAVRQSFAYFDGVGFGMPWICNVCRVFGASGRLGGAGLNWESSVRLPRISPATLPAFCLQSCFHISPVLNGGRPGLRWGGDMRGCERYCMLMPCAVCGVGSGVWCLGSRCGVQGRDVNFHSWELPHISCATWQTVSCWDGAGWLFSLDSTLPASCLELPHMPRAGFRELNILQCGWKQKPLKEKQNSKR